MEDNPEQPIQTEKARDLNFREITPEKPKSNVVLFVLGAIVLISLVIVGYIFLNSPKKTKGTSSKKVETKQATSSTKTKLEKCSGEESLVNSKQGYETCFPKGWIEKELKVSALFIGIDPKQVDDKFPGTLTIEIDDSAENLKTQDISNNTSKFEFGPVKIDGIKGTQVTYTRLKSDVMSAYPKAISSVVRNLNRTYTVTLNSTEGDFETNKAIYETFLGSFKFIDDTKNPPWSESRNILIFTPWVGDSIQSPVTISGEAIAFEGTVSIRVKDKSNHILAQTTTQTASGSERSAFKISVEFGKPATKNGTVEVYTVSAKDGGEQDLVSVSVVFP